MSGNLSVVVWKPSDLGSAGTQVFPKSLLSEGKEVKPSEEPSGKILPLRALQVAGMVDVIPSKGGNSYTRGKPRVPAKRDVVHLLSSILSVCAVADRAVITKIILCKRGAGVV